MNGKAMMAGTTTPHIPSGAELVGSYIVVFVVHRPLPIFIPAQFACICIYSWYVARDSEILYPDAGSIPHWPQPRQLFNLESSG